MPRKAPPIEPLPRCVEPMLLRPGLPAAAARDAWALELKWDGMRAQLRAARNGTWCVRSRPGRDCSEQFPELAALATALTGHDVLLDGELVCLDGAGRPDFQLLRRRLSAANDRAAAHLAAAHPASLIIFDILHLDGRAVRAVPYRGRHALLESSLPMAGGCWRTPSPFMGDLEDVLAVTREQHLEGIVAKRLDALYEPGRRTGAWLKHKHRRRETLAVTGWRPARAAGRRLDAVFVARVHGDGTFTPAGSAELGLSGEERKRLRTALEQRHLVFRRGGHRVGAGIWLEVDFHGAAGGPLRDPVIRALRLDEDVVASPSAQEKTRGGCGRDGSRGLACEPAQPAATEDGGRDGAKRRLAVTASDARPRAASAG